MSKLLLTPIAHWHRTVAAVAMFGSMAALASPGNVQADEGRKWVDPNAPQLAEAASAGAQPAPVSVGNRTFDIGAILAPLMSSPEHRRIAVGVGALIHRDATDQARQVLAEAIETGTFAALMIDQLGSPDLLAFLDTVQGPEDAVPEKDARDSRIQELEAALSQEKLRLNAALTELADRGADLVALEAREDSRAAESRKAETSYQEQVATAVRERETLQSELDRLRQDSRQALSDANDRADAALRERDDIQQRIGLLQGANSKLADLTDALAAERNRAEAAGAKVNDLTRALAAERTHGEAAGAKVNELTDALATERSRAESAVTKVADLTQTLAAEKTRAEAAVTQVADLTQALAAAKTRVEAADQSLTERRDTLDGLKTRLSAALSALAQEKTRADAAAGDMDQLRKRLADAEQASQRSEQTKAALRGETERATALAGEADRLRNALAQAQDAATSAAEAKAALDRERQGGAAAAAELEQLRRERSALADKVARLDTLSEELTKERGRADELAGQLTALRADAAKVELTDTGAEITGAVADPQEFGSAPAGGEPKVRLPVFLGTFRTGTMLLSPPDRATAGDNEASASPRQPQAGAASKEERIRKLVERAEGLLKTRDIAGARLLLESAARSGDGRANYLLAQSYDPAVLAQWQVLGGVSGDEAKARAYYSAARASGYR